MRSQADNPIEDIAQLCRYAHRFRRVYVTLNTILNDEELIQARDVIWRCYRTRGLTPLLSKIWVS